MNIQKSIIFLYIIKEKLEIEYIKIINFIVTSIKYEILNNKYDQNL